MTEGINDGAMKKLILCIAAVLLCGCGSAEEPVIPSGGELPSVNEYSQAAQQLRNENDTTTAASDTRTAVQPETEQTAAKESVETVSSKQAEGSVTESETDITVTAVQTTVTVTITETEAVTTAEIVASVPVEQTAESVSEKICETTVVSQENEETEIMTECSVPMAQPTAQTVPLVVATEYDSDFFSSDLFVGDSISTGYSLYGFLNDKNVFAKVGLNPSTVLSKKISTCYGEIDITDMLTYTVPDRVYVMLGSNGIQWLSVGNMLESTDKLTQLIEETCPGTEVVIVSVPPVTPEYAASVETVNVMSKINEYNASLSAYCRANGLLYVDVASVLKNEEGYFDYSLAESDGMHFKSSAYKAVLSKIQTEVTAFEKTKQEIAESEAENADETTQTEGTEASASHEEAYAEALAVDKNDIKQS